MGVFADLNLTELGTDLGGFLEEIAPGVAFILIVLGAVAGVVGLIKAISERMRKAV
jgi:hypothetical protein